jgi:GR25 family glycosyltransferase involved in LPS biosynthesis
MDISQFKHTYYINLAERPDRKDETIKELQKIGINNPQRVNAVKYLTGAIGCALSHLICLEMAKQQNLDYVLIVEDDITFLNPNLFIKQFNKFLNNCNNWDVVLLSGNNGCPCKIIDDSYVKITRCQTTTGYLVKNHYFDKLIANFKEGVQKLIKEPTKRPLYAIDEYWCNLQKVDNWFLITPLTVVQRPGYSNIENKHTNYLKMMLNLDKSILPVNFPPTWRK